jgi:hypothetical protein
LGIHTHRLLAMMQDRAARLQAIIDATDQHIAELLSFGLTDSAKIFAVAKLELQTKLHDISEEELHAFCQLLRRHESPESADVIDFAARKAGKA